MSDIELKIPLNSVVEIVLAFFILFSLILVAYEYTLPRHSEIVLPCCNTYLGPNGK